MYSCMMRLCYSDVLIQYMAYMLRETTIIEKTKKLATNEYVSIK